jgi:hypothetical protein
MGYYWRKAYVGGDKIEDAIKYIANSKEELFLLKTGQHPI